MTSSPRPSSAIALLRALLLLFALAWLAGTGSPARAAADEENAQTIVHMLDYVGVDYPEFVQDGKVLNEEEYAEQREFATQSVELLGKLPEVAERAGLIEATRRLVELIDAKAPGAEVSALAAEVRAGVMQAYSLKVAPRGAPDLARGASLFAEHCASCHGADGRGDGALAPGMEPPPSDFHDEPRMKQRSIYGLFNTITLGVGGTPMRGFNELSTADRWALAFHSANLRASPESIARGEALWKEGIGKDALGNLQRLVIAAPGEIEAQGGADLDAVRGFLTARPQAVLADAPGPIAFSHARLRDSLEAYRSGDRDGARRLAIAAYLEGFELVEAALDNVDRPLRNEIEREMMALRSSIGAGEPIEQVTAQVERIDALLETADDTLSSGGLSPTAAFVSALLILLREGLEAILVLSAMIAFTVKTGRRDALRYLHAGWIGAVVLGGITWLVARYVIDISGASRELTEGITALLAAAMLLYVGYWLHSRSNARAWQAFIKDQISSALSRKAMWAMAGVSFLAVYRELFEVILFYETLWAQAGPAGHNAILGGIGAGAVLLVIIGGALLRYSVRLPIGPFFAVTSAILALLAVVFVGNGVAALQEAGVFDATAVRFFSMPLLGIYPTLQSLGAQAIAILLILAGLWFNRSKAGAQGGAKAA